MKKLALKDILYLVAIIILLIALITVSVLYGLECTKKNTDNESEVQSYYDMKCSAFELENYNFSKGQIVFIGDSITDGYPLDNFYGDLALRTYNRGISGDRTSGTYRRLKISLFDLAPTKIVLMIGINDINLGLTNDEIMINYTSIIEDIKTNLPSADVTCLSVLPMNSIVEQYGVDLAKATAQIKDLNGRIKTLVEGKGYRYIDLFTHFADENDHLITTYSNDGLHPNNAGYVVWTNVLKPVLNS